MNSANGIQRPRWLRKMTRGHSFPGLWINFESGEGAGKDTQINLLVEDLRAAGYLVETGREPGTTPAGEQIRKVLQDPNLPPLNSKTEMLLYVAAGIEFFEHCVKPVLKDGKIYISNRWRWSTDVYQGRGLGVDSNLIKSLTRFSCNGAYPDITYLLDIEAEKGLSKVTGNEFENYKHDKIEARGIAYHKKVNEGYREIARENPERFKVIPYFEGQPEAMREQIKSHFYDFIRRHRLEETLVRG